MIYERGQSRSRFGTRLFEFTDKIVEEAEARAETGDLKQVLPILRKLSMEDFGLLLIGMPDATLPNLSRILPRMASNETQETWTGHYGEGLLIQTVGFARQVESASLRYRRQPLQKAKILDFGVGYGRNVRSMMYFTDPENIFGVDAWAHSLDLAKSDGILCHLLASDPSPEKLPIEDESIDVAIAFSVFTHISPKSANASLEAIRRSLKPGGIAILTIRPVEYWTVGGQKFRASEAEKLIDEHYRNEIAFTPHDYSADAQYGDTTIDPKFFVRPGWEICGYDTTLFDPYQISIILRRA